MENDTAPPGPGNEPYLTDGLTNDATVIGSASDDLGISLLEAQVDDGAWMDITGSLTAGQFRYDPGILTPGLHTIRVRATDTSGQPAGDLAQFTINSPPLANAGGDGTVPEGTTVSFDASGSTDAEAPIHAYQWTFDDGTTTDEVAPSRHYPEDGVFAVSLMVTDTAGSTHTDSIDVIVLDLAPTAGFTWAPEPQEEGSPIQFTDTSTSSPDTIVTWDWDFDGLGTSTGQNPAFTFIDNGLHVVTMVVTDEDGSTATISHTVTVSDLAPTAGFSWTPEPQDEGSAIQFTDDSTSYPDTIVSWDWDFAGLGTSAEQHPSFTFTDNGEYTVTLTVTDDDGSTATIAHTVTVLDLAPTAGFAWTPEPQDEGSLVQFTDTSASYPDTIVSWQWDFAGLGTSNAQEPSFAFADDGNYAISLTVTDEDGSKDTVSQTVTVSDLSPTAAFGWSPEPQDEGASVQFTDESTSYPDAIISWAWDFDGLGTSTSPDPSFTFTDNGLHTVTLAVTDEDGSVSAISHTVTVPDLAPSAGFTWSPEPQDEGSPIQFTDVSTSSPDAIVSWTWDFAGLGTSDDQNPSFTFVDDGAYTVTLTVTDDDGSSDVVAQTVTVSDLAPSAEFSWAPAPQEEGSAVQFTDESTSSADAVISWEWDFAGLGTSTAQSPEFAFTNNGSYTVSLIVTDEDGSTDTVSQIVTVSDLTPSASFAWDPEPQNEGSPIQFTDTSTSTPDTIVSWSWDFGGLSMSTDQHPSFTFLNDGSHTVTLTVTDEDGSTDTISHVLTVANVVPTVLTASPLAGLEGEELNFVGTFSDPGVLDTHTAIIHWGDGSQTTGIVTDSNGDGTVTAGHTYADNGVYLILLEMTDNGNASGSLEATATITNVAPSVIAAADQTVEEGSLLSLDLATFSDPGFSSIAAGTEETFSATIDWGDATPLDTGLVSVVQGSVGVLTAGSVTGGHTYAGNGDYTVTVTVTDDDGDAGSASLPVHVIESTACPCIYEVPGEPGTSTIVTFTWIEKGATFCNELGMFVVENWDAEVDGLSPGDPGYPLTALTSEGQEIVFRRGKTVGAVTEIVLPAGTLLTPYLVQNSTTQMFIRCNQYAATYRYPQAWFCFPVANSDGYPHFQRTDYPDGTVEFAVEDLMAGGDEDFNDMVFTITAAPEQQVGPVKFFVVDRAADATFRYDAEGLAGDRTELAGQNNFPRGATSNVSGDTLWVIDANKRVFVYNADGSLRGSWRAKGVASPEGIATDGTDIWIVDRAHDQVFRFDGAASHTSGDHYPDSKFGLYWRNFSPTGITTDGETVWVTDRWEDKVFVYDTEGHYEGAWRLDPENGFPTGITLDPAGGTDLWVVDACTDTVYHYAESTGKRSGTLDATTTFELPYANHRPEGIADPPALSIHSPIDGSRVETGTSVLISGKTTPETPAAPVTHVTVNGIPVDAFDATGNFFSQVVPTPGINQLEVVATDALDETTASLLTLEGTQPAEEGIDFDLLSDVTDSLATHYGGTSFNEATDVLFAGLSLENAGRYSVDSPLLVGITNISDPTVRFRDPDGLTPEGIPYYDYSDLVVDGTLEPDESTGERSLTFFNPNRVQFTYDLVFLGQLNQAPQFQTVPDVEALTDRPYSYDADAIDPDDDALTFSLVTGPDDATVDSATGEILWSPSIADLGNHAVAVRAEDGRGGSTEQHYTLSVIEPPPNRPPWFTSAPVVDAYVSSDVLTPNRSFGGPLPNAVGDGSRSVTTGDFNGDGVSDLAVANVSSNDVSVLLGLGDSMFAREQRFAAGDEPRWVTTGDFNGDGVSDLVTANQGSNDVSVLLGHGDGTFAAQQRFATGTNPETVTTGDFNGDGLADLATANLLSDDVSVLLSNGDGTFADQRRFAAGDAPLSVMAGEFDGDGLSDLVVANVSSDDVLVLLGHGDGTFAAPQRFAAGDGPTSVTTGDFDGDGLRDLAVSNQLSDDVSVLLGNGDGTFGAQQRFAIGSDPYVVTVGDFDGDGMADLATTNVHSDDVSVLLGNGDGTFAAEDRFAGAYQNTSVTTGDFNEDGFSDLVVVSETRNQVSVLPNTRSSFGRPQHFAAGDGSRYAAAEDFNGDGVSDLAVANAAAGNLSVLLGHGDGTFSDQQRFEAGEGSLWVVTADFNGDGVSDLAAANQRSDDVSVLLGHGDGTFAVQQRFATGDNPASVTIGDFNGDGLSDIATANLLSDDISVLLGNGDGTFAPQQRFAVGDGPLPVATGDFDGDDVADLVVANVRSYDVSVLLGHGDGTFAAQQRFATGDVPTGVTVEDFDGDGVSDLAVSNEFTDDVSVLLGHGDGSFAAQQRFVAGSAPFDVTTGDFNVDGLPDLAVTNVGSNDISVSLGNGDGTVAAHDRFVGDYRNMSVTTCDFNGDGSSDLAVTSEDRDRVSVLLNTMTFSATESDSIYQYRATADDPDEDPLTFSLLSSSPGMVVDPDTGLVQWAPTAKQIGLHDMEIQVSDGRGGTATQEYTIQVHPDPDNHPPVIVSEPVTEVVMGTEYTYDVDATDPDDDPLSYSLVNGPDDMSIDSDTGLVQRRFPQA